LKANVTNELEIAVAAAIERKKISLDASAG
jgi:hypothetical protein